MNAASEIRGRRALLKNGLAHHARNLYAPRHRKSRPYPQRRPDREDQSEDELYRQASPVQAPDDPVRNSKATSAFMSSRIRWIVSSRSSRT